MKVAIYTLGCKVNTYESDRIVSEFESRGADIVPFEEGADLYIVNTCSVTQIADKKSRQVLRRARHLSPDAVVIATGCFAQQHSDDLPDEVDFVVSNEDKPVFVDKVMEYLAQTRPELLHAGAEHAAEAPKASIRSWALSSEHTRVFLKVQDGCRQFCSYCIIPYLRGALHSVDSDQVLQEANAIVKAGYKEIVLTGIHLSSYGRKGTFDDPEAQSSLGQLIVMLSAVEGLQRIRLGSLEPGIITAEFIELVKNVPQFCPQFHLALQSGCAATLKSMNRHYTPEAFLEAAGLIYRTWPQAAITTDLIVGFPGESETDFQESMAFLDQVGFARIHVFKYSRRRGTAADRRPGQVPETVKNERSALAIEAASRLAHQFAQRMVGTQTTVLFEEQKDRNGEKGVWVGYSDNYMKTYVMDDTIKKGDIRQVRIRDVRMEHDEPLLAGEAL